MVHIDAINKIITIDLDLQTTVIARGVSTEEKGGRVHLDFGEGSAMQMSAIFYYNNIQQMLIHYNK